MNITDLIIPAFTILLVATLVLALFRINRINKRLTGQVQALTSEVQQREEALARLAAISELDEWEDHVEDLANKSDAKRGSAVGPSVPVIRPEYRQEETEFIRSAGNNPHLPHKHLIPFIQVGCRKAPGFRYIFDIIAMSFPPRFLHSRFIPESKGFYFNNALLLEELRVNGTCCISQIPFSVSGVIPVLLPVELEAEWPFPTWGHICCNGGNRAIIAIHPIYLGDGGSHVVGIVRYAIELRFSDNPYKHELIYHKRSKLKSIN